MLFRSVAVAGLSLALSGQAAWGEMASAPYQFFAGALSPFDQAQRLISAGRTFIQNSGFLAVLSVVAAKLCALNAMPLTYLNGGDAVAAIGRHIRLTRWWPKQAALLLYFVLCGTFLLWVLAIVSYALST